MKVKRKGRPPSAIAEDFLSGRSKNQSANVEELRKKREADAIACGRTVRTVHTPAKPTLCPGTTKVNSADGDEDDTPTAPVQLSMPHSSSKSLRNLKTTEYSSPRQDDPVFVIEKCLDDHKSLSERLPEEEEVNTVHEREEVVTDEFFTRRQGKEVLSLCSDKEMDFQKKLRRSEILEHAKVDSGTDNEVEGGIREYPSTLRYRGSPSKNNEYTHIHDGYERRKRQRSLSPKGGSRSQWRRMYGSMSRSPPHNSLRKIPVQEFRSPRRNRSRSPSEYRAGRHRSGGKVFNDYDDGDRTSDRLFREYDDSRRILSGDHRQHRRHSLASVDTFSQRRRSDSEDSGRRVSRRKWTPESSKSPPRSMCSGGHAIGTSWSTSKAKKEEDIIGTSPAIERRERRRQQGIRESQKDRRLKEGKKTFYLTLDAEGQPFGPGKPAWMAEINKLAVGLDPSCTHIRKQTFEDVQTFKDRLNEKFDYSGMLNEDYLRGLMGKAVTKRRGELLTLIKNDGDQPSHIDKEIWKRLEKLAHSKQREDKSEQGRYANACRKTCGRTGSIGMNGIREKLRSLLRRSPDPEEVEEEMQRDKGYGGQKRQRGALSVKKRSMSVEVIMSEDELPLEGVARIRNHFTEEACLGESSKRHGGDLFERNIVDSEKEEYRVHEMDVVTGRKESAHEMYTVTEMKKISTDDYIKKLQAQIERLEAQNAKGSTRNDVLQSQSAISAGYDSSD